MLDKIPETAYLTLRLPEGILSNMKTTIALLSLIFVSTVAAAPISSDLPVVGNSLPPCENSLPPSENTLPPSDN